MTVAVPSRFDRCRVITVAEFYIFQFGREGRVTAVIGPVGVEHTDLGERGISLLISGIIILDEEEVLECHREIQRIIELSERRLIHGNESVKHLDIRGLREIHDKRVRLCHRCFAGIDRIDAMVTDDVQIGVTHISLNDVRRCRTDHRLLVALQESDALHGGISPLIELSRKIFYGKDI